MEPQIGAYAYTTNTSTTTTSFGAANNTPSMQEQIDALSKTVQEQALLIFKLQLALSDRDAKLREDMEKSLQERMDHLSLQMECQSQDTIAVSKIQYKHLATIAMKVKELELRLDGSEDEFEAFDDKFGTSTSLRQRNNSLDDERKGPPSQLASPPLPRRGLIPSHLRNGSVDATFPRVPRGSLSTQSVASSSSFVSSSSSSSAGIDPMTMSSSSVRNSKSLASPEVHLRVLSRSPELDPDYVTPRARKSPVNSSVETDNEPS